MPFLLLVLCLLTVSCTPLGVKRPTPSPVPFSIPAKEEFPKPVADSEKLAHLVSRLNDFSLKLYGALEKEEKSGNLAVSPVGVFFLLELLCEGAVGKTEAQLKEFLGRSQSGLAEVELLAWELNRLPSLVQVQKIFVDKLGRVAEGYEEKIDPVLGETIQVVPFGEPEAGEQITAWIQKNTGLAQHLPAPDGAVCALVSVLCFQGRWVHEFPTMVTARAQFAGQAGDKISVPMMSLGDIEFPYFEGARGQGVALPLRGGVEMVLVLPAPDYSVSEALSDVLAATPEEAYVELEVPRFQVDSAVIDLDAALAELGLEGVLREADLSRMIRTEPKVDLNLDVFHRALVTVDEKGAEAKAVSSALMTPAAANTPREPKLVTLRFNRPFGFLLRHQDTQALLMVGRVEEPEIWQ